MPVKFRWEKEFKETEIGEIPKDWEVRRIKEITNINMFGKKGNPEMSEKTYFISMEHIPTDGIYPEYVEINPQDIKSGIRVSPNSILLAKITPSFEHGKMCIVPNIKASWYATTEIFSIIPAQVNLFFLFYTLKHSVLRDILEGSMTGTSGRQRIQLQALKNLPIPYPSLEEQSRIATVLSWFDELIEVKKKQNEILEKTAMAIFRSWFIDFEPFQNEEFIYSEELQREIPKGWEVKRLEEVVKVESGGNAPQEHKYFAGGNIPFVRVKHLTVGPCIESSDFINEKALQDYKLKIFHEGSILIQKSGESLREARVNLLPFKACVVNHLAVIDLQDNKNLIEFLFCNIKSVLNQIIDSLNSGTSIPYLKLSDLQSEYILLPPQPILQKFHSLVQPLFEKIINNQKEIIILKKVRDTLLPLLVFGKLRVEEV